MQQQQQPKAKEPCPFSVYLAMNCKHNMNSKGDGGSEKEPFIDEVAMPTNLDFVKGLSPSANVIRENLLADYLRKAICSIINNKEKRKINFEVRLGDDDLKKRLVEELTTLNYTCSDLENAKEDHLLIAIRW